MRASIARAFCLITAACAAAGSAFGASVDGASIHWSSAGSGDDAVILVHGWTCDETSWREQVPALSGDYRVITLDLPGHGKSGAPSDGKLTMERFARAVEAVRAEAGVDDVVLVGHSMGTPVIRKYALLYPEHAEALVLVDGLVQVPGEAAAFEMPSLAGAEGLAAREGIVRGMFSAATPEPLQQHILRMMLSTPEAMAQSAFEATWDPGALSAEPTTLPVLGLYADHSALHDAEAMRRIYPTIEYHEIPGAGHFLMMEKPQEFNALLLAFLRNVAER